MAAAAIGWYGPLIDLSKASSHVGDYVQLLVFVHKSTPVQYKLPRNSGGGEVIRMDIQVGDDTRPYFPVSIWQKQLRSTITAGDIVLLQNIKIARFRDVIEARTLQCSLLQCLVHSKEWLGSKGIDELMRVCQIGMIARDKLHKVIEWVKRAGLANFDSELNSYQSSKQFSINWKMHEEAQFREGFSLMQLKHLPNASKAMFRASVGEIFLPITWRHLPESEAEKMFISRRIYMLGDDCLADLISTGCQLCGTPLSSEVGSSIKQKNFPLCPKSYNGLHDLSMIYRPFQLYVWDDSHCIPLLVMNKAAEMLFGNIRAKNVYASYQREKYRQNAKHGVVHEENHSCERTTSNLHFAMHRMATSHRYESRRLEEHQVNTEANYDLILLILLKMLLKKGKNSPLKFSVIVNSGEEWEGGRYEVLSVSLS